MVASAINMSGFTKEIRSATPDAGEHTNEILKSVGYSDADIARHAQEGSHLSNACLISS